jgi:signal transduction histidine kinase
VVLAGVPVLLASVGLADALRHPTAATIVDGHLAGGLAMATACGLVAALLLTRLPRHPVGIAFEIVGLSYGLASLPVPEGALRVPVALIDACAWIPGVVIPLSVLPVVFPDGSRGRWERRLLKADIAGIAGLLLGAITQNRLHLDADRTIANPLAVSGATALAVALAVVTLPLVVASVGVLLARLRRSSPGGRRQIAPFVVAGALAVLVVGLAGRFGRVGAVAQDVALLLVPLSALVCVLRFRLYDLEIVVRRTVVWLVLSAGVLGGYVLLVQGAASLLRVHGQPASVLATAGVALAFGPMRAVVSSAVARWLFGERGDPYESLARTTAVLAGGADPRGALEQAADDLAHGLRCPGVRIVREDAVLAGSASGAAAYVVPLRAAGREVGRLEVLGRGPTEPFSPAERRLLGDLAAPLAQAVDAVGLAEDLRSSRDALLRTREEERRRIRSELHDDIGPTLSALLLQAQIARRRLPRNDQAAVLAALDLVQSTALRAVSDLRRVVDDLRPGALDEVGFVVAVRSLAESLADEDLRVDCVTGELPELPAALEAVGYRVVAEALHNVRRHSGASCVEVALHVDGLHLVVRVSDDGVGPGAAFRPGGTGLPTMRARLEELDGSLRVESGPERGTVLDARIPLAPRSTTATRRLVQPVAG